MEVTRLLAAADVVTLCRTGVDYDYRGYVIDAHAPEMPTRLPKQLLQLLRGACAIGINRRQALRLAIRCARDSMPPLRLSILEDVAEHPATDTTDIRRRLNKPRATVERQLEALHMLGALSVDEEEHPKGAIRRYTVADHINPAVIACPEKLPPRNGNKTRGDRAQRGGPSTHKSGQAHEADWRLQ
jgi:hypothetical protein